MKIGSLEGSDDELSASYQPEHIGSEEENEEDEEYAKVVMC